MAVAATILPEPIWYFVDNNGEPLSGGFLYIRLASNPTQNAVVYQDINEVLAYPTTNAFYGVAIPLGMNGSLVSGPIYWDNATDYYIFWTDSANNQINSINTFGVSQTGGGGGGGGGGTTFVDIENLVQNNTFFRNTLNPDNGVTTVTPVPTFLTLAPGAHAGFSGDTAIAVSAGSPSPDICFIKNTAGAVDNLSFGKFPLGSNALTGDVTPLYYLHYDSNAFGGETFKYVQFPICSGAQNLSNQTVSGKIWYRWNSGIATLNLYWRQFYGSGPSASSEVRSGPQVIALTTDGQWHSAPITLPIPSATGKTYGECGNDGLFLQVEYPIGSSCDIDFTKPAVYVGSNTSNIDFHSNDQIDAVANDFRTGDVRTSLNSFSPFGWVTMDDGNIGSASSGATTRANRDTFPLYALLWNGVSDTYAPVSTGRGATAIADFSANKTIGLTKTLGRALSSTGTPSTGGTNWALGQFTGSETHTIAAGELPSHVHPITLSNSAATYVQGIGSSAAVLSGGPTNTGGNVTANSPIGIMQPTTFMNVFIKL